MLCIEVRGGVVVAAYSDETSKVIIIDHDDSQVSCIPIAPESSIPDDALDLINVLSRLPETTHP